MVRVLQELAKLAAECRAEALAKEQKEQGKAKAESKGKGADGTGNGDSEETKEKESVPYSPEERLRMYTDIIAKKEKDDKALAESRLASEPKNPVKEAYDKVLPFASLFGS